MILELNELGYTYRSEIGFVNLTYSFKLNKEKFGTNDNVINILKDYKNDNNEISMIRDKFKFFHELIAQTFPEIRAKYETDLKEDSISLKREYGLPLRFGSIRKNLKFYIDLKLFMPVKKKWNLSAPYIEMVYHDNDQNRLLTFHDKITGLEHLVLDSSTVKNRKSEIESLRHKKKVTEDYLMQLFEKRN